MVNFSKASMYMLFQTLASSLCHSIMDKLAGVMEQIPSSLTILLNLYLL